MAHAEKCPICNGNGNLNGMPDNVGGTTLFCKACGGAGWVEVSDGQQTCSWQPPDYLKQFYPEGFTIINGLVYNP